MSRESLEAKLSVPNPTTTPACSNSATGATAQLQASVGTWAMRHRGAAPGKDGDLFGVDFHGVDHERIGRERPASATYSTGRMRGGVQGAPLQSRARR